MPQVSTIIPAYNAAAFVREAIDSALAQEGVEQEIIVIDDGSTDETPRILAEYGDRIRNIRQANAGQHAARNCGAQLARGQWLAFLDADDVWMSNKLRCQLETANASANLRFTQRQNFGCIERVQVYASPPTEQFWSCPFRGLLIDNPITTSSVIMQKKAFDALGGFDVNVTAFCEDWDLWLRYAEQGGSFDYLSEPLVRYRIHPGSTSRQSDRMRRGRLEVLQRALSTSQGRSVPQPIIRKAYAALWLAVGWDAAPTDRWSSLVAYGRSVRYQPTSLTAYKNIVKCLLGRI